MPIYPGPGAGGGSGAGDVTADPAITNWDTATDGWNLNSNGDGTATFEAPTAGGPDPTGATDGFVWTADGADGADWEAVPGGAGLDATGITDGFVPTADGADGWDWEAPSVGGLLTPDGLTSIGRSSEFNVRDYGASGSRKIFYGTSTAGTYTTNDSAGTPTAHDFRVGQGVLLLESGDVCDCATPDVTGTHATITNQGSAGSTTYGYKFVAYDADGAHSAASDEKQTTTGNATLSATNFNRLKVPIRRHAVSVAIYGRGTSNWKLLQILDVSDRWRNDGTDMIRTSFTLTDNGSTQARFTTTEDHGLQVGDFVQIKCTSGSTDDAAYSVEAEITAVGSTTQFDCAGLAYDAGAGNATGYLQAAHVQWDDKGDAVALHATKYVPDHEMPPMVWRAGMAVWLGQVVADRTGNRLYRVVNVRGNRRTGTVEPTWTAGSNTTFVDNEVCWRLELAYADVTVPPGATRKNLWTTIATVPTASTFTIADAAGAEIGSNKLLIAHNDALAFRNCLAAARTFGQPATFKVPAGYYPIYTPRLSNSTFWTNFESVSTRYAGFLPLISGVQSVPFPNISIDADAAAHVAIRQCQNGGIVENLNDGTLAFSPVHEGYVGFIYSGINDWSIDGGTWEWAPWSGGLAEVDNSAAFRSRSNFIMDSSIPSSNNLAVTGAGVKLRDVKVHWPFIWQITSQASDDGLSYRNAKFFNCELYYGGGDGDGTFHMAGGFVFDGGVVENVRRLGTHGMYLGGGRDNFKILNATFKDCGVGASSKFAIQIRVAGGSSRPSNILIDNNTFINCGPILAGDATSSNRQHDIVISNCMGTGVSIRISECRGIKVDGGTYGSISVEEDCRDVRITNLTCNTIDARSSDTSLGVHVENITFRNALYFGNITDLTVRDIRTRNPYTTGSTLNGGLHEWALVGGSPNEEYQVSLRGGGDPSLSLPTGMLVFGEASIVAGALNALSDNGWYYGNTEVQTIAISGSPTGGSFTVTYNGNTSGSIAAGASAATVQTALRLVTGLSAVTVLQSGSGNNLTYRVAMTGVVGDPPQMTSTSSLTGGTPVITHATPNAYPGYDTIAVKIGDSLARDPDANMYGAVQTIALTANQVGLCINNTIKNAVFEGVTLRNVWDTTNTIASYGSGTVDQNWSDVKFKRCHTEYEGHVAGANDSLRMWDFTSTGTMEQCDRVEFEDCTWLTTRGHTSNPVTGMRMNINQGGYVKMIRCKNPNWGSEIDFGSVGVGVVDVIDCEIQTNESEATVDAGANTFSQLDGYRVTMDNTTADPVYMDIGKGTQTALPVMTSTGTPSTHSNPQILWFNATTNKVYPTAGDAAGDTNAFDITTANGPVLFRFLNASRVDFRNTLEWLGYTGRPNVIRFASGNIWRGGKFATYADVAADANNFVLMTAVNEHRINPTGASRAITGIDAPGAGTVHGVRHTLFNISTTQDLTLPDRSGSSVAQNTFICPGAATYTIGPGHAATIIYDAVDQGWRVANGTA